MKKILCLFILLTLIQTSQAKNLEGMALKTKRIVLFAPVFLNPDSFSFEIGFLTRKSISSYQYNAYAKAFLGGDITPGESEDRSSALGAKVGVLLPTQSWTPLLLDLGFGFAKTAYQQNPWFGKNEDNLNSKDMLLAEVGLMYVHKKSLIYRVSYQENNVDYFTREVFFSIGGTY